MTTVRAVEYLVFHGSSASKDAEYIVSIGVYAMKQTGAIKGLVRDADHLPIGEVSVVIVTGPSHQDIAALTSSDGTFGFGSLQPGRYVIKAYGSDVESDDLPVQVLAGQVAVVEIWLETDIVNEINSGVDEGCG